MLSLPLQDNQSSSGTVSVSGVPGGPQRAVRQKKMPCTVACYAFKLGTVASCTLCVKKPLRQAVVWGYRARWRPPVPASDSRTTTYSPSVHPPHVLEVHADLKSGHAGAILKLDLAGAGVFDCE